MKELFIRNREKLFKNIPKNAMVFLFSASRKHRNGDQYFPFRQDSSFFYFTGINQHNSILVLFKDENQKCRTLLFIYNPTEKEIIYDGIFLSKEEARNISGIKEILFIDSFQKTWKDIMDKNPVVYSFLPDNNVFKDHLFFNGFYETLQKNFPVTEVRDITPAILSLRMIKEPEEIAYMKKAIEITKSAFEKLFKNLKQGVAERELYSVLLFMYQKQLQTSYSFEPIVATGKNACTLHYKSNDTKLNSSDMLLVDTGAEYYNYAADITRTVPVSGKFSSKQKFVYQEVLQTQKKAISLFVPGATISEINNQVNTWMETVLIDIGLVTAKDIENQSDDKPLLKKYYPHGVTHFIGLDVHDVGENIPLQKGMVLTCEPGLYIPEWEIGIRIEDNILIDGEKPQILSADIPKEIDEVERWIQQTREGMQ